jgi:hypothetical protein
MMEESRLGNFHRFFEFNPSTWNATWVHYWFCGTMFAS